MPIIIWRKNCKREDKKVPMFDPLITELMILSSPEREQVLRPDRPGSALEDERAGAQGVL